MLSKSLIPFSVDGRSSLPAIYLGPNYGGGNEDNGDLIKRSHGCTATLSAPNPAAGHHRPTPPPETPGHSQASLGQSLVGPLLLPPGSGAHKVLSVTSKSLFPQSCVISGGSVVGLMATSSEGLMPYAGLLHPEPLPPQQSTADLCLLKRHPNIVLSQSLWGLWVLVHTRYV